MSREFISAFNIVATILYFTLFLNDNTLPIAALEKYKDRMQREDLLCDISSFPFGFLHVPVFLDHERWNIKAIVTAHSHQFRSYNIVTKILLKSKIGMAT